MRTRPAQTVNKPTKLAASWDAHALLLRAPWLARVDSAAAAARLAPHCRFRAVQAGESVIRRGSAVRHLTMVVQGALELGLSSAGGRQMVIDQLPSGRVVGLAAMIDARASLQDARASVDSVVMLIPRTEVLAAARELPGLANALMRLLAGSVRGLLRSCADRSLMPLRPRLAALLLRLLRAAGALPAGRPDANLLPMAQDELAAMLGVTRQHLSPALKQLEREGLIQLRYRCIEVVDRDSLSRMAAGADR